jgi:hypothetical protein
MRYGSHCTQRTLPLLGLLLALTGISAAQQRTGSLEGTIKDTTGGLLPGTTVELRNVTTGITQSQVAGIAGYYSFSAVQPGAYRVQAALKGFKTVIQDVTVEFDKTARADFTLAIGTRAEQVVVTSASQTHDATHSELSLSAEAKVITELPTLTHDITHLIELMPGIRLEQAGTVGGSQIVDLAGNFALGHGTRRGQSLFYVDGAENVGTWRHQSLQMPNPDAIQEVQIITSSASAEFGKEPGVRMNIITKSGTSKFHGTALFATHATGLNANTWSANLNNRARPTDVQKWVAGTLGGPILSRTFFFASFQHFYDNEPSQLTNMRMPTPAMLKGDFTAIPNFTIKAIDPATGKAIGKVVPSRLIHPIAAQMAMRFPTIPQYSNDPMLGRFHWQYIRPAHNNLWIGKIDHQLFSRHQLSGLYLTTEGGQTRPDNLSGSINYVPGWGGVTETQVRQHTFSIRHFWAAARTLVVENRVALARQDSGRGRTGPEEDLETMGGIWPMVTPGIIRTLPSVFLSGGPAARGGQISDVLQQNARVLSTTNWLKGKHNLRFGAEVQYSQYSRLINYDDGQIRFTGAYANTSAPLNGPWPTLSTPSGDNQFSLAWADFLMGRVRTFQATGAVDNSFSGLAYFFFAQDQFKVTPRLTITPGLRYELYGAQTSNRIMAGHVAGHYSDRFPNAPLGIAFAGDRGIPEGLRAVDRNNFAPRLGLAWDMFGNGRTVLRAGTGLYYAYPPLGIIEQLAAVVAAPTLAGAHANLPNPWGSSHANSGDTSLQYPGGMPSFDPNPATRKWQPGDIPGFDPKAATPYQWQFSAGIQRQPIKGVTILAGYVGNRARKSWSIRDNNLALWAPNAGTGNVDARRPDQTWRGIHLISSDMNESYDAAELSATLTRTNLYARMTYVLRRYLTAAGSEGLEVGIDNTPGAWAGNPRNIRGDISSVVSRQQIRGFVSCQLPSVSKNFWMKPLLGGWQVSGTINWYDGDRLNVVLGPDYNYDGFKGDRPNQVGPVNYLKRRQGNIVTWIDRTAFAIPPAPSSDNPYPFGTLPRNAVRGPNHFYLGAALTKNFYLKEKTRLMLRADTSNLLNHPNLSDPAMDLSRSDFGLIQTKEGGGRIIQLQAKLFF